MHSTPTHIMRKRKQCLQYKQYKIKYHNIQKLINLFHKHALFMKYRFQNFDMSIFQLSKIICCLYWHKHEFDNSRVTNQVTFCDKFEIHTSCHIYTVSFLKREKKPNTHTHTNKQTNGMYWPLSASRILTTVCVCVFTKMVFEGNIKHALKK